MSEETETIEADDLSLYMYPSCPYCRRVTSALDRLGVDVEIRNTRVDDSFREELVEARGRATVPVLRIAAPEGEDEDVWMPESADIVRYLEQRFGDGSGSKARDILSSWLFWAAIGGAGLLAAQWQGVI
jgi:glutathione S-transferase